MQTASHAILNVALFDAWCTPEQRAFVAAGAVLPDMPIYLFYLYHKHGRRIEEKRIWKEIYYRERWYNLFALFHSIPAMALIAVLGWALGSTAVMLVAASALLHNVVDFPLHAEDAHRHFYPFSNFRFESPISYWDPERYGRLVAGTELVLVAALSLYLYPELLTDWGRAAVIAINAFYLIGYVSFYLISRDTFSFDFVPEE